MLPLSGNYTHYASARQSSQTFKEGGNTMEEKAETFKKEFCKSSLPYFYLSHLTPIAYIKSRNSSDAQAIFTEDVKTYFVNNSFSLYKGDVKLADGGDIFVPAKWVGDNVIVAFSENGYENCVWTIPSEIKAGSTAKIYVVDAEGPHYIGKTKVRNRQVTLSLQPGQMIKLEF